MCSSVHCLHPLQSRHFGEDECQQAAPLQVDEPFRGDGRGHNLVQFVGYAFLGDDFDALLVAAERFERLIVDIEVQLCGKAYATHHAQGVVAEGDVRVKRCAYGLFP